MPTSDSTNPYEAETRDAQTDQGSSTRPPFEPIPERVGRYRIKSSLGRGGFGVVYLAIDEQLERDVAVKIAHRNLMSKPADMESYLAEARIAASLDHQYIVPVHDVGSSEEVPFYSVSKFISGADLSTRVKQQSMTAIQVAELVARIADALHYAHKKGLVHRDVKPANILIDESGKPFLTDFGLALREEELSYGEKYVGTPVYSSPEQVRGESHRVDGRSDIFSLGVVLYELLSGRRPFKSGPSNSDIFREITTLDPKPLRQYDERIPKELARICSKAMAKRARDRYPTAFDMQEDLEQFLEEHKDQGSLSSAPASQDEESLSWGDTKRAVVETRRQHDSSSSSRVARVVPKGLRSFNQHDSEFFLDLLPGPRDKSGLPASVAFWKNLIEERDADHTFPVGLIYGPSGCGKSSMVKAGLIPNLEATINAIYIESTPNETASTLHKELIKQFPELAESKDLASAIIALRTGDTLSNQEKLLIVIDQFEQCLHARDGSGDHPHHTDEAELIRALRQCDCTHVQCILMVRDDFWMNITRFMRDLEVPLVEHQNSAAVDLFPIRHAEKVLAAFGRAYGALPDNESDVTQAQKAFLKTAAIELAQDGLVISVRLALFAEMMKNKAWTVETLVEVGGTQGVGATFLEETFSASSAPPIHRYHQNAARRLLAALLPTQGTQIKGNMRSREDLMIASEYQGHPQDFRELIEILDRETRLITPAARDSEANGNPDEDDVEESSASEIGQYYQLTHDYLVPSLRRWLTKKQSESRRGRAELLLSERAGLWGGSNESRLLPSLIETVQIRTLTEPARWSENEARMMRQASRFYVLRAAMALGVLLVAGALFFVLRSNRLREDRIARATEIVNTLGIVSSSKVEGQIAALGPLRDVADGILEKSLAEAEDGSTEKLRLMVASPPSRDRADYLTAELPSVTLDDFPLVLDALPATKDVVAQLWSVAVDESQPPKSRFQSLAALATLDPDGGQWKSLRRFTTQYLINSVPSLYVPIRIKQFDGAKAWLVEPLLGVLRERTLYRSNQRERAAMLLSEYLRERPSDLVEAILIDQDPAVFETLFEALSPHADQVVDKLVAELPTEGKLRGLPDEGARRAALAVAALVRLDQAESAWPLFKHSRAPTLRSLIIHSVRTLVPDGRQIVSRLKSEKDVTIQRALLQILSGLDPGVFSEADKMDVIDDVMDRYRSDPDPGIHGAALRTLQRWNVDLPTIPPEFPKASGQTEIILAGLDSKINELQQTRDNVKKDSPDLMRTWIADVAGAAEPKVDDDLVRLTFDPSADSDAIVEGTYEKSGGIDQDAIVFAGDAGLDLRSDFRPDVDQAYSMGCWVKPVGTRTVESLVSRFNADEHRGFDLIIDDDKLSANLAHSHVASIRMLSRQKLERQRWQHVFVTYDGSGKAEGVALYLDGAKIFADAVEDSLDGTMADEATPLLVGARFSGHDGEQNAWLNGVVDSVRIYDRELSPSEVDQVFFEGVATLTRVAGAERRGDQEDLLRRKHEKIAVGPADRKLNEAELLRRSVRWKGLPRWYVSKGGPLISVIAETTRPREVTFKYVFGLAAHEVTVAQYLRSKPGAEYDRDIAINDQCPMHKVSWYDAAEYCNWLSDQDGLERCYRKVDLGDGKIGWEAKPNALALSGYRLPTIEEWRYACRAGAVTSYHSGNMEENLIEYGWCTMNSRGHSHPVGSLLPNEYGLFDMHGNLWEWCQTEVGNGAKRSLAGDAFNSPSSKMSSTSRTSFEPDYQVIYYGFRVARTIK